MTIGDGVQRVVEGRVLTPGGWLDGDVVLDGPAIASVGRGGEGPPDGSTVDAAGKLVVPGFLDLQINGGFGYDLASSPASVWSLGERLPATGVTSFLPTLVSGPPEIVWRALEVLAAGPPEGYVGATPLGWHLEGPMLAPSRRGVHEARWLRPPRLDLIEGWNRDAGIRMVTIAPELDGAGPIVRALREQGVIVSIGHSEATFEEAVASFDAGICAATHLFNAMSGLHHRAPGVAGAALARDDVVAGLIVDGIHVHPAAVATAWRAKGPGGIALVTDAVAPMNAGPHAAGRLGAATIEVREAEVRDVNGTLAGSTLTLDRAVRNMIAFAGAPVEAAVSAATSTPAAVLAEGLRGRIEPGAAADLAVLDRDLQVVRTIVEGRLAFERPAGVEP